MALIKLYCSSDFFRIAIENRTKKRIFHIVCEIMSKIGKVSVCISKAELSHLMQNEFVNQLYRKQAGKLREDKQINEVVSVKNTSNELILVGSKDMGSHEKIRKKYGCLILSYDQEGCNYLNDMVRSFREFNLSPISKRIRGDYSYDNSWSEIFNDLQLTPINSLIITDNFMFGDKFEERKEYSLFNMLKSLVPKNLEIEFHLTIFFCNQDNILPLPRAQELIEEIKNLDLCKSIKVSLVAHTIKSTTHDREIISNYHYVYSGSGFCVVDKNGVQQVAKGEIKSVFFNIDYVKGKNTLKHTQSQVIDWLKPIYNKEIGMSGPYCYIEGDEFKNRLFE